jgi:hypothetical protein
VDQRVEVLLLLRFGRQAGAQGFTHALGVQKDARRFHAAGIPYDLSRRRRLKFLHYSLHCRQVCIADWHSRGLGAPGMTDIFEQLQARVQPGGRDGGIDQPPDLLDGFCQPRSGHFCRRVLGSQGGDTIAEGLNGVVGHGGPRSFQVTVASSRPPLSAGPT